MKIKKSLVEQIIKEEAIKVKKLIALKEEKNNILKQLNELYEEGEMQNAQPDAAGLFPMEEGQVEEGVGGFLKGLVGIPTEETVDAMLQKYFDEIYKGTPVEQRANWAQPGTDAYAKARQAALDLKSAMIYWHPTLKKFMKKTSSGMQGHTFGGGAE
jgi:hypothetical protein